MNGIQGLMQQAQPQGQPQMPGQAPQMPGQAPMPGMMPGMQPQQRGPTPGIDAQTPMLKQLDLQQLKQLYAQAMMPGAPTNISPYAILSAISEKAKQEKAMRAVQSAAVQGQNAQQQNAGSIAQQVMQEADQMQQPVMARHGGVMHGYAGGGIVAFQSGTSKQGLPFAAAPAPAQPFAIETVPSSVGVGSFSTDISTPKIYKPSAEPLEGDLLQQLQRLQEEARTIDAQLSKFGLVQRQQNPQAFSELQQRKQSVIEKLDLAKRAVDAAEWKRKQAWEAAIPVVAPEEVPAAQAGPLSPEAARIMRTPTPPVPPPPPATFTPVEDARRRSDIPPGGIVVAEPSRRAPPPEARDKPRVRPPAPAPVAAASAAPSAADQELQNYLSSLRTRQGVPEDVAAGRAGLESLVREEMKARQDRLAQDRAAAEERRKEALERAPGVFSPEGLLGIAASIDPRRGYELGSAARGAFGIMGAQRKAQEEARREFREFEKSERTEQNLLSQMRILEVQRQQAIREGDATKANEITDKLYATARDYKKHQDEMEIKRRAEATREAAVVAEREKATATRESTSATREATTQTRLQGQLSLDVNRMQNALADAEKKHLEKYKAVYSIANLPGSKLTDEQQKALDDANRAWQIKKREVENTYLPGINAVSKQLYGTSYSDVQGGGAIQYDAQGNRIK